MILPKGKPVYENLNTSFTNLGELLLDLNANGFTGYVRVVFWQYDGLLYLDRGKVVTALEDSQGKRRTGSEAASSITNRAREKNGVVGAYQLSPESLTLLAGMAKSEVVYKDLSTDFTSLDRLMSKLQAEEHTGYVEVTLEDGKGSGTVFLQGGRPVECILVADGREISGASDLPQIVETAAAMGAVFNVYKVAVEAAFADSGEIMTAFELPQLLGTWGEIIGAVERTVDGVFEKGRFAKTFKEVRIEKAGAYPFLDPFAAELSYAEGQLTFSGESVKNLSAGLADCLEATVDRLASESKGADLSASVKAALQALKQKETEAIARFALDTTLPGYLT